MPLPNPTQHEMAILQVLWTHGPSTVREVHERLAPTRASGYTTILKAMQVMLEKGLVARKEDAKAHVYEAVPSEEAAQKSMVKDLMERAFGGSAHKLVMRALSDRPSKPEELAEIRRLLDELEGKK